MSDDRISLPTRDELDRLMTSATPKPRAGEHTAGPWFLSGVGTVLAGKSRYIVGDNIELHNARRIVACVNYCEGVDTMEIEQAPKDMNLKALLGWVDETLEPANRNFDTLKSQNAELIALIKLYLLTAERGTLTRGAKKLELADIDAEARSVLAKYGR